MKASIPSALAVLLLAVMLAGCGALPAPTIEQLAERRYITTHAGTYYEHDEVTGWRGYQTPWFSLFDAPKLGMIAFPPGNARAMSWSTGDFWGDAISKKLFFSDGWFDNVVVRVTFKFDKWYFIKSAKAQGQSLQLTLRRNRDVSCRGGGCSHYEAVDIFIPTAMALDSACTRGGLRIAAIGDYRSDFRISAETLHAFLDRARKLGAKIKAPLCNFTPILTEAAGLNQ